MRRRRNWTGMSRNHPYRRFARIWATGPACKDESTAAENTLDNQQVHTEVSQQVVLKETTTEEPRIFQLQRYIKKELPYYNCGKSQIDQSRGQSCTVAQNGNQEISRKGWCSNQLLDLQDWEHVKQPISLKRAHTGNDDNDNRPKAKRLTESANKEPEKLFTPSIASEVASNKKRTGSEHLPIKVRSFAKKMDDSTPMRGFSAKNSPTGGFISPNAAGRRTSLLTPTGTPLGGTPNRLGSLKKEGGIKLLDITAQPFGAKEAKRRRRIADMEAMEQAKKVKEEQKAAAAAAAAAVTTTVPYTPDYAAGLVSPAPSKLQVTSVETGSVTSVFPTQTVSYVPGARVRMPLPNPLPGDPLSATTQQARDNLQQQLQQQLGQPQIRTQVPQTVNQSQTVLQPQPAVVRPLAPPGGGGPLQPLPPFKHIQQQQNIQQQQSNVQQQQIQQQPQQQMATDQQQQQPKKGLSLTRDQMLEAREMFRTSNKVTRPEKVFILVFMAGSRENPCPQLGNILSIRLSESKELVTDVNQIQKEMIVDTFFQMNYMTGDWKRVKKFREVDDSIL